MQKIERLKDVVENGLCIGCGLCAAIGEKLEMTLTEKGEERPIRSCHGRGGSAYPQALSWRCGVFQ